MLYLRQKKWLTKRHESYRFISDTAYLIVADVLLLKGEFVQAGLTLEQRLPYARNPFEMRIVQAWYFILGQDLDQSRMAFERAQNSRKQAINKPWNVVIAYLNYKLYGTKFEKSRFGDEDISRWEEITHRWGGNPFGPRLREILDEITPL